VTRELDRVARAARKVQKADAAAHQARAELREAILAAHREGASMRRIAGVAGVSYTRVFQIIRETR
jgi:hypothetical protein